MIRSSFPAPSAEATIGFGPANRPVAVHLCLNLPGGRPMVDLAAAITALTSTLGGHWKYRYTPDGEGTFIVHCQEIAP
jgi:hypothetical protein